MNKAGSLIYYYHLLSQPSRVLKILLDVNKIPYTPKVIDLLKGGHLHEEYTNINPFQRVPAIKHNDFFLTESVAIARYLCREMNIPEYWYPKDSVKQAKVDEFLEWQHIELRYFAASYFQYSFLRPMLTGKQPNAIRVEFSKSVMERNCDKLENIWLKNTPYLCGNNITIADIFGACELEQPKMSGYNPRLGRPKLDAWMARVNNDLNPHYDDAHKFINDVTLKHKGAVPSSLSKL